MRHLLLEGPDGGGKTRLAEALKARYPYLATGRKASGSLSGPVADLKGWVEDEFTIMDSVKIPFVYDRHPLISEPIYGTIARGGAQNGFQPGQSWLSLSRDRLAIRVYVIWCIPPLQQVVKAVADDRDMPGVRANIEDLHQAYLQEMIRWEGPGIRYNLTAGSHTVLENGLFSSAVEFVDDLESLFRRQVFN